MQICNDQIDALNKPFYCDFEVILTFNNLLLNIKLICHLAYLIELVEILP